MADKPIPITLQLVERIAGLLRTVTVANGFRTDIGKSVSTEPIQLDDDRAFGAVVYVGGILPTDDSTKAMPRRRIEVVADAYVGVALADAQQLLHEVNDDIERLFADGIVLSVTGALPLEIGAATFIPRTDDMATGGVQVVISATYSPGSLRKNP